MRQEVVALLRVVGEAFDGRVHVADKRQLRVLGQIMEKRGGFIEEQRQVILDTRRRHAVADVLVYRRTAWIALENLTPATAEGSAGGFIEGEFAARQQANVAN